MSFQPFKKMQDRVAIAKEDSDSSYFFDLLYFGEMITKLTTCGIIAMIGDDVDRHRYRQAHSLVRAESLGSWVNAIQETVSGPTSHFLLPDGWDEKREPTQRRQPKDWQYDTVKQLHECLKYLILKSKNYHLA